LGRFVSEIERDMPASELLEWIEYERIEPFGAWRDNWHTALVATILANAHRKPNSPPVRMSDFFFIDPESRQENQDAEMIAFMDAKVRDGESS
jgi:hypothetical protein